MKISPVLCISICLCPYLAGPSDCAADENSTEALDRILSAWEESTSQIQSVGGEVTRFQYDTKSETEKNSFGRFLWKASGEWRLDVDGRKQVPTAKSSRISTVTGMPFRLENERSVRVIRTSREVLVLSTDDKLFDLVPFPDDDKRGDTAPLGIVLGLQRLQVPGSFNPMLDFIYQMKAADVRKMYKVTLKTSAAKGPVVEFLPQRNGAEFSRILVLFDEATRLPFAMKQFGDAPERFETVYTFQNLRINAFGRGCGFGKETMDPIHPDLKKQGFQLRGRDG